MTRSSGPNIQLLITLDYEVFHGRNFLPDEEVLFRPASELLKLASELQLPLTFFADICSVWAHQKAGLTAYVERFESQLRDALKGGHDVQLHLHPHWLVAEHSASGWHLTEEKIQLPEFGFGDGELGVASIVRRGRQYLEQLLQPVKADYRCLAFRAGGLALQPGEKDLFRILRREGIRIESSVAKDLALELDTVRVDYRGMPDAANWFVDPECGLAGGARQGLYEIPVATFHASAAQRLGFLVRRGTSLSQRRGTGISRAKRQSRLSTTRTLVLQNLRYLGGDPVFLFSADTKGFSSKMLLDGFDDYVARHAAEKNIVASMLNHPKLMFAPQLKMLREVITGLRERHGARLSFETYERLARSMPSESAP